MGTQALGARPPVRTLPELPDDAAVAAAIDRFAAVLQEAYGDRLKGLYLFGSRARGDHRPESDADIAVILEDGDWDYWAEIRRLAILEYDVVVDTAADVQAHPFRESEWREAGEDPWRLVAAAKHDARSLGRHVLGSLA